MKRIKLAAILFAFLFFLTASGDTMSSGGQDEVMAMFDADGVPYSYGEWNAQDGDRERNASVNALTEQGLNANMVRFERGSVLNSKEHSASFNYGYNYK